MTEDVFKERIKYIKKEDRYIGKLTNYPCCCQTSSLEELKDRLKKMLDIWIKIAQQEIDNDNFSFEEIEEKDFLK